MASGSEQTKGYQEVLDLIEKNKSAIEKREQELKSQKKTQKKK